MSANVAILALMAFAATSIAQAHDPTGTPRNYCEDPSEWATHDYGYPPAGNPLSGQSAFVSMSVRGGVGAIFGALDGNIAGDCNFDGVAADYDLHIDFATGGAFLTVHTVPDCNSEIGHHPTFGPISVYDDILGETMPFWVASDFINAIPPVDPAAPNCGDFESDESSACISACTVTFPAGLDGTYQVYIGSLVGVATTSDVEELMSSLFFGTNNGQPGSKGHIRTQGSCCKVNCLLGTCETCCREPVCACDITGVPSCSCQSGL
jgi:hypothetical protein